MTDLTDAEYVEAHAELSAAIARYYARVAPDVYLDGWVLITHKRSIALEADRTSAVGLLVAQDQSWVTTRGLLDVALQRDRDEVRAINGSV